jgi:hypothetical protein
VINSWPYYSSTKTSVIIDNMATLELLFTPLATEATPPATWH